MAACWCDTPFVVLTVCVSGSRVSDWCGCCRVKAVRRFLFEEGVYPFPLWLFPPMLGAVSGLLAVGGLLCVFD